MDNYNLTNNDSLDEYSAQQLQDQRPPVGQTPGARPGQRPPAGQMPGTGPGQRPPAGQMPGTGPGQRPPAGQMPGTGPGQRPPAGQMPGTRPGQRPQIGPVRPSPAGPRPPVGPPPGTGPSQGPQAGPIPPGLGQQPRTAPPNFIPPGPNEQRGVSPQLGQFRERARGDFRTSSREFYGCLNRFTYLWLINGNNFWFFPIFIDRQFVIGFRWRRNRWEFDRINVNRIFFFSCF